MLWGFLNDLSVFLDCANFLACAQIEVHLGSALLTTLFAEDISAD